MHKHQEPRRDWTQRPTGFKISSRWSSSPLTPSNLIVQTSGQQKPVATSLGPHPFGAWLSITSVTPAALFSPVCLWTSFLKSERQGIPPPTPATALPQEPRQGLPGSRPVRLGHVCTRTRQTMQEEKGLHASPSNQGEAFPRSCRRQEVCVGAEPARGQRLPWAPPMGWCLVLILSMRKFWVQESSHQEVASNFKVSVPF